MDRDEKGRFIAGNKANPGGRPKGLADQIRVATKDGAEIITFLLEVGRDTTQKPEIRLQAFDRLLERGWGKVPTVLAGDKENPLYVRSVRELSDDDLAAIASRGSAGTAEPTAS